MPYFTGFAIAGADSTTIHLCTMLKEIMYLLKDVQHFLESYVVLVNQN